MADAPLSYREFDFSGLAPADEMHMREQVMGHLHAHRRAGDDADALAAAERALEDDLEALARMRRRERD